MKDERYFEEIEPVLHEHGPEWTRKFDETAERYGITVLRQSNPEWPVRTELSEDLGDRSLLDGSTYPPRDATTCDPLICP